MCGAVIFDLDGTLVDSLPGISASLNRALRKSQLPVHSGMAVRGFIGNGSRSLVTRASPVGSSDMLLDAVEGDFKADYDLSWREGTHVFPGMSQLLLHLHSSHRPLAVLSNKPQVFTTQIVAELFPEIAFAAVVGHLGEVPHKPHPAGALRIAGILGVSPGHICLVGDSTIDLETASNAGMKSLAVTWGYHDSCDLLASKPDMIADTPEMVASLLF